MLFIKTLTINGFKAFAIKTVMHFEEGVAVLIGPNGCGKSNVIEAIRWCLGEHRTSDLRGKLKEDVIFHGSKETAKSGMAEVEVIINNHNSILPMPYSEVAIGRRLFRSGDSEFLLNGKSCRLRDIQNLLLDTGIGRSTYSIIEQGKIDKILSQDPQERRGIFEEAASISRYRKQRLEYDKKMVQSKENLSRVSDILREYSKQKTELEKQAKKREQYFSLNEKLQHAETHLLIHRIAKIQQHKAQLQLRYTTNSQNEDEFQKQLRTFNENIQKKTEEINEKQAKIHQLEKTKHADETQLTAEKTHLKFHKKRYQELIESIERREKDVQLYQSEKVTITATIQQMEGDSVSIRALHKTITENIQKTEQEIVQLNQIIHNNRQNIKDSNLTIQNLRSEQKTLLERHAIVVNQLVGEIDSVKTSLETSTTTTALKPQQLTQQLKELITNLNQTLATAQKPSSTADTLKATILSLKEDIHFSDKYQQQLQVFLQQQEPLYKLIFSSVGAYAKKEKIDKRLIEARNEMEVSEQDVAQYTANNEDTQKKTALIQKQLVNLQVEGAKLNENFALLRKNQADKQAQLNQLEQRGKISLNELAKLQEQVTIISTAEESSNKKIETLFNSSSEAGKILSEQLKIVTQLTIERSKNKKQQEPLYEKLKALAEKREKNKTQIQLFERDIENLHEQAQEKFGVNLALKEELEKFSNSTTDIIKLRTEIEQYKNLLRELGSVNLLAAEELANVTERYDNLITQKNDIEQSMENLKQVAQDIDINSKEQFMTTFKAIQIKFNEMFAVLFEGGEGKLTLTDENEVWNSGVDIHITPPGKRTQNLSLFSGGERSLIAISIMFSIFLIKTTPICLLDEVDAALDSLNVDRLAKLINKFKDKTQFLIISHNEKTVTIADYIYGVTMLDGVSKVISLKFEDVLTKNFSNKKAG